MVVAKDARTNDRASALEPRKPYSNPVLVEFGPVGVLTQAGTGKAAEGMGKNQNDPTRRT